MKRNYELIDQEPYECVGCALHMVLKRNNLYAPPSNIILENFEKTDCDGNGKFVYTQVTDLNKQFFEPRKYPLKEEYYSYNFIQRYDCKLENMIKNFFKENNDIIIFGNYTTLVNDMNVVKETYDEDDYKLHVKHVFLVEDILDENNIILVSPEVKDLGGTELINTSVKRIKDSFDYLIEKNGLGYSIIKRTDK